jgi:hypothetical protein
MMRGFVAVGARTAIVAAAPRASADDHGARGEYEPGDDHGRHGEAEPGDD